MSHFEKSAITVSRQFDAPASDVWAVLSDGWLYPCWVVGAARMREVESSWWQQSIVAPTDADPGEML